MTAPPTSGPGSFVLEIGSEELPAADLTATVEHLRTAMPEFLAGLRLHYETLAVHGTPRRVAVLVEGLAERQPDAESTVKGPPADRAFDAEGKPSPAALGFARSRGVSVTELQVIEEARGRRYLAAVVRDPGRAAVEVLAEALPNFMAGIGFAKSMRWNHSNISYSRPLRWLVALYGSQVVPFTYAGLNSGRHSRGLRPYGSPAIVIDTAGNYQKIMRQHGIMLDTAERQATITATAMELATRQGGVLRQDADLLDEVANLVESPTPFCGHFAERFLALPSAVLVAVMKKHQRYFPVYATADRLLPCFIAVRNGDALHLDTVIAGNEHVLRARFADAEFFYKSDTQHQLADFLPRLATLTFQADLGSMLDKVQRLTQLTPLLAAQLGLSQADTAIAERAAALSKADLATHMVVEMTSLQGIMGAHYARLSGEPEAVAMALAEQYQAVSTTRPGLALALADRLDSLVGLFAAGLAPRGSNDPFALRRAALGIIENLTANGLDFDLRQALQSTAQFLPVASTPDTVRAVLQFIGGRLEGVLRERGYHTSVIKAVLAEQAPNPYAASQAVAALDDAIKAEDWLTVLEAYARCVRITRPLPGPLPLRPEAFTLAAEQALWTAYQQATATLDGTASRVIAALRALVPVITTFFIDVLVMDEDSARRDNRLALLQRIASLPQGVADLSQLEGF